MDMRMMGQRRTPGVQHAEESGLGESGPATAAAARSRRRGLQSHALGRSAARQLLNCDHGHGARRCDVLSFLPRGRSPRGPSAGAEVEALVTEAVGKLSADRPDKRAPSSRASAGDGQALRRPNGRAIDSSRTPVRRWRPTPRCEPSSPRRSDRAAPWRLSCRASEGSSLKGVGKSEFGGGLAIAHKGSRLA